MARLFIDGFESGDALLWDSCTLSVSTVNALFGSYGVKGNNNANAIKTLSVPVNQLYGAVRIKLDGSGWENRLIEFRSGTTVIASIEVYSNNLWRLLRGTSTILATGTHAAPVATTFLLEFRYVANATTGIFQLKINGLMEVDFTGNTGTGPIDNFRIIVSQPSYYTWFDNIILDDAEWIGDTLIQAIVPNVNGDVNQWTPSAGQNYQCIDEIPASAADFVSATQGAQVDLYQFTDLTGDPPTIKAVQVQALALKQGNPNPQFLQLLAKSASYQSPSQGVPSVAKPLSAIWEIDPDTGQPWTPEALNAAQFGIRSATS